MSGPKGWALRVESVAERARREMQQTEAQCRALCDRLDALRGLVELDDELLRAPGSADLAAMQSWQNRLQRALEVAEREAFLLRAEVRIRSIKESLSKFVPSIDPTGSSDHGNRVSIGLPDGLRDPTGSTEADDGAEALLDRFLARVGEVEDEAELQSLTQSAHSVLALSGHARQRGWDELGFELVAAVKRSRIVRRCGAEAAESVLRIAHVLDADAETVRSSATRVRDQTALTELRAQIERVLSRAERDADAVFVSAQASLVLEELGYVVDEPFESLGHAGTVVHAHRDDLPDHAMQIRVNSESQTMLTSVVARSGSSRAADTAAEDATCGDVFSLAAAMPERGVRVAQVFHLESGEVPVEHTLPSSPPSGSIRAKKKSAEQSAKDYQR